MCRDRLPTKNQDLARFGQNRGQDWGEMWPDGFSQGPPRAGIQLGGGVSVSGCDSGPCWAILGHGGSVRGHFPYFRGSYIFPNYFSYFPIITGVAGLLLPVCTPQDTCNSYLNQPHTPFPTCRPTCTLTGPRVNMAAEHLSKIGRAHV